MSKTVPANSRAHALSDLSRDQMMKLEAYARIKSQGTGEEGDDLLNGAIERWLKSAVPCTTTDAAYNFLKEAISSIRSNIFRHARVERQVHGTRAVAEDGGDDPVEQAPEAAIAEAAVFLDDLYKLCEGDEDMQELILARYVNTTRPEIQAELGWDDTKYETVMKRKKRLVARWTAEGKLR